MCGITGIISLNKEPISPVKLKCMTDVLAHRGPDGEGHFIEDNVGLGHRRLAIIDLSAAGHQPMQTRDGRYVITYNGEIYNFKELRIELESLGYIFHSETDSEVVLNAYHAWKEDMLPRFNGMFAFAIWDKKEKKLFCARDRYGVKPFYYYKSDQYFIFASEIKAILVSGKYEKRLNETALIEYLTFQNFFTNKTLFNNINMLSAGCYLKIDSGGSQEIQRYWDFNFREELSVGEDEAVERVDHLFKQAVSRQLVSDVPVSCYLSGGMDSGAITVFAASQMQHMQSFTVGFDLSSASGLEMAFDERSRAEHISYLAKTEHYEMVLKAGDMERCMSDLVWHLEEPRIGQSYPNFYAAKLASKFGKVVLAGTGSDEIFAGYPWRYFYEESFNSFDEYIDHYYQYWQRLFTNDELALVAKPLCSALKNTSTRDIFENVFINKSPIVNKEDYINHALYFEAKTFLHGLLVMEDKLSMAHHLETRVPFLDNDLVDFSQLLPIRLKLDNIDHSSHIDENSPDKRLIKRHKGGKKILRNVMKSYIPREIYDADKQGFSAPDSSWFKGESIRYVKDRLLNKQAHIYKYLDYSETNNIISQHLTGERNRRLLIWSLLYLEEFFSVFEL
jgi:asparagine synthase (glutamine-hydrolysing)